MELHMHFVFMGCFDHKISFGKLLEILALET
jgi:hypothetical protein